MLLLLPKDIVRLIDTMLYRYRIGVVLHEYGTVVVRHTYIEGAIVLKPLSGDAYCLLTYNYRWLESRYRNPILGRPLYDKHGFVVAKLPLLY
jgi:hypothetical protein